MKIGIPVSPSIMFWSGIGVLRWWQEHNQPQLPLPGNPSDHIKKVAVCIAAHNEEAVINNTIHSLQSQILSNQIYIVSDGSTDTTADHARAAGCKVLELTPGRGKAAALEALLRHFRILDHFRFVLIADADTIFSAKFFEKALTAMFRDPKLAVISARANSIWPTGHGVIAELLTGFRFRLWHALAYLLIYGQTSSFLNVNAVVPGYASLYRSSVLRWIKLSIPGLAIEDFNIAFQIHKYHLGRIGFFLDITATSQDPDNLQDFWRQQRRWNIGFWQTIKYWKIWPSLFWFSLSIFIAEVLIATVFLIMVPIALIGVALIALPGDVTFSTSGARSVLRFLGGAFIGFIAIDYLVTLIIAVTQRRDKLAIYGVGFFLVHFLNAVILLTAIPSALVKGSSGRWVSPRRWQ